MDYVVIENLLYDLNTELKEKYVVCLQSSCSHHPIGEIVILCFQNIVTNTKQDRVWPTDKKMILA